MKEYDFRTSSQAIMIRHLERVVISLLWVGGAWAHAGELDLHKAVIVSPANLSKQEKKALTLLVEEVQKRTLIRWEATSAWPAESIPVLAVGQASSLSH